MSIGVPPCAEQVETEGDEPEHGEEPVEEIEAAGVEVGAVEPAMAPTLARGGVVDHLDEEAPQPRRGAEDACDTLAQLKRLRKRKKNRKRIKVKRNLANLKH